MAHRKEKKKINQNDLRKLMKERKENLASSEKDIDSPLAKYDNAGRLSCIACNEIIKAGTLWRTHILSKTHKKNLHEKFKRKHVEPDNSQNLKKFKIDEHATQSTVPNLNNATKEKDEENILENLKRLKAKTSSDANVSLIQDYATSSDDEENDVASSQSSSSAIPTSLPPDFFDNNKPKSKEEISLELAAEVPNEIPEGFFDDPILDAQARHTVYKDPLDEEMEKFQREIAAETNVSENMIDEEMEQSFAERNIEQIDEQMHYLSRVIEVVKKSEKIKETVSEKLKKNNTEKMETSSEQSDSETDEKLLEELSDWRAKKMW